MRHALLATTVLFGFGTAANALTVSIVGADLASAKAAETAFLSGKIIAAQETFEGFAKGTAPAGPTPTLGTAVGTFTDNDPRGIHGNDGFGILPKADDSVPFSGRFNTTLGGEKWLDSFDSRDVTLSLTPGNNWTGLSFIMTDLDDQGADTQLELFDGMASLGVFDLTAGMQLNGTAHFVGIDFMGANVTDLRFTLADNGDGWGIDDITATAVPLPAAAWMLIAGVGALAGVSRRRR